MSFTLDIDHNSKIIQYRHTGSIKIEQLGEVWDILLTTKEFTEDKYDLLSDFRNSRFDMELSTADEIVQILKTIEPIIRGKKQALILDDPYSTAGSIIFRDKIIEETGFLVKIFCTEDAAIEWLTQ